MKTKEHLSLEMLSVCDGLMIFFSRKFYVTILLQLCHCSFSTHNFLQSRVTSFILAKTAAILQQTKCRGLPRDVTLTTTKENCRTNCRKHCLAQSLVPKFIKQHFFHFIKFIVEVMFSLIKWFWFYDIQLKTALFYSRFVLDSWNI